MNCSLYIHIPFCKTKCEYCDFFSVACGNKSVPDSYVQGLCNEIFCKVNEFGINSFSTVYIGGGTPSLLTSSQIKKLLDFVFSVSDEKPFEVTMELNPDDVSEELICALKDAGVNRISLGIQAFEQKVLEDVKRRSSLDTVRKAVGIIKNCWNGVFSADVIAALPCQSESSFLEGLEELVECEPEHISMYSLTIEEGTPLGKRFLEDGEDYDFQAADEMWLRGREFLEDHGYGQYEVSNFSKPGYECKHNMVYWKLEDYIGCGAGATGSLYEKETRFTNTKDISRYVEYWNNPKGVENAPGEKECIPLDVQKFEYFMMGLRTLRGVCKEEYERRFSEKFPEKTVKLFEKWQKQGMAFERKDGDYNFVGLNKKGILFLNAFLKDLID